MFETFIFDMDGVLVKSEPVDLRAWLQVLQRYGVTVERNDLRKVVGMPTPQVLEHLGKKFGKKLPEDLVHEKRDVFYQLAEVELEEMPGVREILDELVMRDIPVGLASASESKRIQLALRKTGLTPYFRVIASGESVKRNKPAPDLYLHVARCLGVSPEHCAVVEDSVIGVQAAKAAGMAVFGYASSLPEDVLRKAGATAVFSSFSDMSIPVINSFRF
jgi:HAD superfamily hydrolase (TIGR01509 family)